MSPHPPPETQTRTHTHTLGGFFIRIFVELFLLKNVAYVHNALNSLIYCINPWQGSLREHKGADEYVIPHGDWFEYVSCPHYLAEIVCFILSSRNLIDMGS